MYHLTEFKKKTDLQRRYGSNAYILWVLGLYLDEPDLEALASRALTDGSNDKCMDFVEIDKTGQKIVIVQGFFSEKSSDKAKSKKASDLMIAASWIAHGDSNAKTINERARARSLECRQALESEEIEAVELLYIHNLPESLNSQEELDTCQRAASKLFGDSVLVTCKEFGLREIETLFNERSSQILVKDRIKINGTWLGTQKSADWTAHVYSVRGEWLRELFKEYDERLFSANYRGFLGISRRKKINSAIRSTASSQPEDFWVFNNGITLLTDALTRRGASSHLTGISIINGAQTTGSLGHVGQETELSNVWVMCRVVVCKSPDLVEEIVKYNNTQNKITTWDQYANDETQSSLRTQFKNIGFDYSVKRGFDSVEAEIGIEKAAQPVLAFNGHYVDAIRSKNAVFDRPEIYRKAFSDRTATHILLAYSFSRSIDEVKRSLATKAERTENEEKQLSLFNYLSFKSFLLACIGASLQQFVGGSFESSNARLAPQAIKNTVDEIATQFDRITRQVLRAVSTSIENRVRRESVSVARILKSESSLIEMRSDLNSFLESVLDGQQDAGYKNLIHTS
ncbi:MULTISPECIES: AIPR family protein [unclassified Xanthomonas]|uniref:AIPR family protein n=1 Tax=unclassified Xanthomonas TaxID=2643310 RepID=UPI0003A5EF7C|nr:MULTISPECIES: AIPR family protein [unclassified Xanthomonas]